MLACGASIGNARARAGVRTRPRGRAREVPCVYVMYMFGHVDVLYAFCRLSEYTCMRHISISIPRARVDTAARVDVVSSRSRTSRGAKESPHAFARARVDVGALARRARATPILPIFNFIPRANGRAPARAPEGRRR